MNSQEQGRSQTYNLTVTAIVAALYVAITTVVAPFSFGPVQLRLSEGLNHLAAWNKRYIIALGLGVLISNFLSPLGWIDWVFGTLGTVIMTSLTYYFSRSVKSTLAKLAISTLIISTIGMAILAAEFTFAFNIHAAGASAPADLHANILGQWLSFYLMVLPGELASLIVGGIVIFALEKVVNLSK
ncbi:QueT transporter family protein [Convivina praedatoris]|uniref:Queuosine transporter QueT n=1 Tax=Convivina praedatoris TaxID=2880963 RepID=A0ABM9D3G7_9LACO|nr:QueT transporter family protein [Convivina sp. LMG 32447]CAH1851490.1 Queuosine precursor transporter QueT [Convivina sp. LMG 32447]CAH1853533.1 Queuosine precursor transporter QueT [Convivina sp. LMG 32447]CAH1854506.1 Queuosine precursor transporter QueT [Convivina sp. LMG 32447]